MKYFKTYLYNSVEKTIVGVESMAFFSFVGDSHIRLQAPMDH